MFASILARTPVPPLSTWVWELSISFLFFRQLQIAAWVSDLGDSMISSGLLDIGRSPAAELIRLPALGQIAEATGRQPGNHGLSKTHLSGAATAPDRKPIPFRSRDCAWVFRSFGL